GGGGPSSGGAGLDFDLSDLGSFGGLGDLFSSIFGRRGAPEEVDADEVIEVPVSIPFKVAALGGNIPIPIPMPEVCPTGGGKRAAPGATIKPWPECKGRGTGSFGLGGFA